MSVNQIRMSRELLEVFTPWFEYLSCLAICKAHLATSKLFLSRNQKKPAETCLRLAYSYYNDLITKYKPQTTKGVDGS